MEKPKPDSRSADMERMQRHWRMVDSILGGTETMRAQEDYLPRLPDERIETYKFRRKNARFTNIFRDIVENLAARPFSRRIGVSDEAPPDIVAFADDVDGQGSSLHGFAAPLFFNAIARGLDWILVDYTAGVPSGATVAEERAMGARPYWVRIAASRVLAVYTDVIAGREEITHFRFAEATVQREGFGETVIERVRVFNREPLEGGGYAPATWQTWREVTNKEGAAEWLPEQEPQPISIGVVPVVPLVLGRRIGSSWQIHPPMQDAAELQIEHYQQESGLKHISLLTAFPMLAGNGVEPPIGDDGKAQPVAVGPQAVLFAPPAEGGAGSWEFVEPAGTSLKFMSEQIAATARELRELGRQPLTAQSGNLTVITTAVAAQKGNAAIQAWALTLQDALRSALRLTAMWLRIEYDPDVTIPTDFDLGIGDDDSFAHVLALRTQGEISREAALHEAKRRGILDADYDGDADIEAMLAEMDGGEAEDAA